ncbi:hypothetical protein KIW84_020875 [Lathyrus oleraceus]|uniref:Uncharacterized protein n=1 Tax=Pisum sativum TaxID=3888 RepID=A0A9D4Y8J7_PEA|nr:hypothetical protein KIW84_020875 [Pisum sativum]
MMLYGKIDPMDIYEVEGQLGKLARGRGQNRQNYTTRNHPTCQLCNECGHEVMDCWHRFDEYFEPTTQKSQAQATTSTNSNNAQEGNKNQDTPIAPINAYLAYQDQVQLPQGMKSQARLADPGASHHITSNSSNFQYIKSCVGANKIVVGNGHSIKVQAVENIKS